jgi:hypothetical protein
MVLVLVGVGLGQITLGMMIIVDARLPAVQPGRRNPFGATVFALAGGPAAFFDEAVGGPQAKVRSSMLVRPPSAQSTTAWWAWQR